MASKVREIYLKIKEWNDNYMIFQCILIIIISLIGLISIYFLFKYPEIAFGLFLIAGLYKEYIRLINILPNFFDLTVFLV